MHRAALQLTCRESGSACGPVIIPVFKTGGWRVTPSPVGSTPTRFRHCFSICLPAFGRKRRMHHKPSSLVHCRFLIYEPVVLNNFARLLMSAVLASPITK